MVEENVLKREYDLVEGYEAYDECTELGRKRLEEFKKIYEENKEFFGKKVLDLACGGGIVANFLARNGHDVTGVDVLEEMIKIAEKNKPFPENPKYIKANIIEFVPEESYDTVIIWGNAIPHFSPKELAKVLKNVKDKTRHIIISYVDSISWGFEGRLKHIIYDEEKDNKILDFYTGYNPEKDSIVKTRLIVPPLTVFGIDYHLYNPGIVEGILYAIGFELKKRVKKATGLNWIDFYEKVSD